MRSNLLVSIVLAGSLLGATPASATASWEVDLTAPGAGSTNVVTDGAVRLGSDDNRAASAESGLRTGIAVYPHRLAVPANTFLSVVRSSVPAGAELAIDVRGWVSDDAGRAESGGSRAGSELGQADDDPAGGHPAHNGLGRAGHGPAGDGPGQWTEWVEIRVGVPGVLPVAVQDIEVRVMLMAPDGVASPVLEALVVTPSATGRRPGTMATAAGLAYPVFATREGLVGHTTANGHRIVPRDHFVALPSRRGLSGRRTGDYSVRVCAANGRCAWAPVWDGCCQDGTRG